MWFMKNLERVPEPKLENRLVDSSEFNVDMWSANNKVA